MVKEIYPENSANILRNPENTEDYNSIISNVMRNIVNGDADEETVNSTAVQIADTRSIEQHLLFNRTISNFISSPETDISDSVLSLLLKVYGTETVNQSELKTVLKNAYLQSLEAEKYSICADICIKLLENPESAEETAEICQKIRNIFNHMNEGQRKNTACSIHRLLDKYGENNEDITVIGKSLFGTEPISETASDTVFFPLFVNLLPHSIQNHREYIDEIWSEQYSRILENTDNEIFIHPEKHLKKYEGMTKTDSLLEIEIMRIKNGHISDWGGINEIISAVPESKTAYQYINRIIESNPTENQEKLLGEIKGTQKIYALFISGDGKSEIIKKYIIQDKNPLQNILKTAEKENLTEQLPNVYIEVWSEIYSQTERNELWKEVISAEKQLRNSVHHIAVMQKFGQYFRDIVRRYDYIVNADKELVSLIYRGIKNYSWTEYAPITPDQKEIIEICYMIDNPENIGFFISKINEFSSQDNPDIQSNLEICSRRIDRMTDNGEAENIEKNSILAFVRLLVQKHSIPHCNFYYEPLNINDESENAPVYILYALKYLFMVNQTNQKYIQSFIEHLRHIITDEKSSEILTSPVCRELYYDYIRKNTDYSIRQGLYSAAKITGNQKIIEMFRVSDNSQLNVKKIIAVLTSVIISFVIINAVFMFSPEASVITAAALFVSAAAADIIKYIRIRKRSETDE